jgi:hypothetical protein
MIPTTWRKQPASASLTSLWTAFLMLLMAFSTIGAHGSVTLLLEEPYGHFGGMNPTGHSARGVFGGVTGVAAGMGSLQDSAGHCFPALAGSWRRELTFPRLSINRLDCKQAGRLNTRKPTSLN